MYLQVSFTNDDDIKIEKVFIENFNRQIDLLKIYNIMI